jgi:hypothetical protein
MELIIDLRLEIVSCVWAFLLLVNPHQKTREDFCMRVRVGGEKVGCWGGAGGGIDDGVLWGFGGWGGWGRLDGGSLWGWVGRGGEEGGNYGGGVWGERRKSEEGGRKGGSGGGGVGGGSGVVIMLRYFRGEQVVGWQGRGVQGGGCGDVGVSERK